ncbi:MAG: DUF2304 domain-containing protein [Promicromonosporaceae bacterium]|nr:DUF2304 domain-containing protein [Promicromonosporaceae bacterium]
MWIQIVFVVLIVFVAIALGRSTSNARHQAFRRLFLLLFVLVAAAAILFPQLVTRVANLFGIGRGADLLLYLLVITFIGTQAMASRRAAEAGRKLTLLTRKLALLEAERDAEQTQPEPPAD